MSGFDNNPFVDPVDMNPFHGESITQATSSTLGSAGEYNPFSETEMESHTSTTIPISAASSQPAVLQTSVEQSEPNANAATGQAALIKQQEELERKAADLERKDQELQNSSAGRALHTGDNNWPPLPSCSPVKPCFYQTLRKIPEEYRRTCKRMYYLWMFHSATLFLNVLACLASFTAGSEYGVDLGLSIVWFMLFSPVAFICWYRPVYKAFRSDNSFSFFFFFFVFFFQVAVYVIQAVGIPKWGNRSVGTSFNNHLHVGDFKETSLPPPPPPPSVSRPQVHSKYRRTGASFTKAQQEFSSGVLTNRTVQTAASNAATSAAQGAFDRSQGN
uniref:Secretory carrier-associated membrane protein n=1 Tax=Cyclopterus lumpus TaxID=8103 RepID=A0A8C3AU52_CYCLU